MFEVFNGFSGLGRDIILRLCSFMWGDAEKIKAMIGMCEKHYGLKNHSFFLKWRPSNLSVSFRSNPNEEHIITCLKQSQLSVCTFDGVSARSIFLQFPILEGFVQWRVVVDFGKNGDSDLYLGAVPTDMLTSCDDDFIGRLTGASFYCNLYCGYKHNAFLFGVGKYLERILPDDAYITSGTLVTIEVDCIAHTLHFFQGRKKIPHVITGIPLPTHLGVSGLGGASVITMSLRRLPAAPASHMRTVCKKHMYGH